MENSYEDEYGRYLCSGAKVWLDGKLIINRPPTEFTDYTEEEIIDELLRKLGYSVSYTEEFNYAPS